MSSAFPNRHIDKADPEYQKRVRHMVVLKPPPQGASEQEFVSYLRDIKSAIEATTLSDPSLIPHSSYNGKKLTLQSLKDEVTDIISRNPVEWIRGCVGLSIMHHPERRELLISILSPLLVSAQAFDQKLISVSKGDDIFAFNVRLHENRHIDVDSLRIWLENPSDPAAEHLIPSDQGNGLTLTDIYSPKEKMEYFAMRSLQSLLVADGIIGADDPEPRYEPLGNAFPDFELVVHDQEWAVEVARVEEGMISYLDVSKPLKSGELDRIIEKEITDAKITGVLTEEIADKTEIRKKCTHYRRACLLLVDVVDVIDVESSTVWGGIDFSAFDAVALVKMDGKVSFIKPSHCLKTSANIAEKTEKDGDHPHPARSVAKAASQ